MSPDDPRHGSKAGRSQHHRDGEDPCDACRDADNADTRRRRKRKHLGHVYRRELGADLHSRLVSFRTAGATYGQIAAAAGVGYSQAYDAINRGPEYRVNASTWLRLHAAQMPHVVTIVGLTRRVQALQWNGFSVPRIAAEVGMSVGALRPLRDGTSIGPLNRVHTEAIVDVFERWQLLIPEANTTSERKSVNYTRSLARRAGYVPALAWTDIDDPDETPSGVAGAEPERQRGVTVERYLEDAEWLADGDLSLTEVLDRLGINRDTFRDACRREGRNDLFVRLADREFDAEHRRATRAGLQRRRDAA